MNLSFNDGLSVTLDQMLHAKELRVHRQKKYLIQYHLPIISLTLVIPGPIKNSSGTRYLFAEAMKIIKQYFDQKNIQKIIDEQVSMVCGLEAILVFHCDTDELKKHCIMIEESHPLGRLWDIDVIDPKTQISVSRSNFLQSPRQCLVCQNLAKACSRNQQHSLNEIINTISQRVNKYRQAIHTLN